MKNLISKMMLISTLGLVMGLVACQPNGGNKDDKNQEVQYARLSYDRCLQINHYEACNSVRTGSVLSLKEYFGLNTNYNFNGNTAAYGTNIYNPNLSGGYGYNQNLGGNYGYNPNLNGSYGYNTYPNTYGAVNNGYGYNGGIYNNAYVTQYSSQQIEDYFSNYIRRASKEEILDMASRWNSGNTANSQYVNPGYRTCTAQGCY